MFGTALGVTLAVCAAAPADPPLAQEADAFGIVFGPLTDRVAAQTTYPVSAAALAAAGLEELFRVAGEPMPADLRERLKTARSPGDLGRLFADARLRVGRNPALDGFGAYLAVAAGFATKTDPYCGFVWQRAGGEMASSENDFGLGLELDGATGPRWVAYMAELSGVVPRQAGGEPAPPVGAPWRVRRVLPGSAAAYAGLRAGDLITRFDGLPVTAAGNVVAFRKLLAVGPSQFVDADSPPAGRTVPLVVTRPGAAEPVELRLDPSGRGLETVFGVTRRESGGWDHWIDPAAKIGYVRLAAVETGAEVAFARALHSLDANGAAGLILDLRWCPGGYLEPLFRMTGSLVPSGKPVALVQTRPPARPQPRAAELAAFRWRGRPILALVNGQTTGGGELIATALQDNGAAVVAGQRTFGKGISTLTVVVPSAPGLGYRTTAGFTLRPSGINRHRFPDSKPTDPWGVKPDRGFDIPTTPEESDRLREQYESAAVRGAADPTAVGHDPFDDPQLMVALKLFKERLAKK